MSDTPDMQGEGEMVWRRPPVHEWFGLSRSAYLVIPRLALEAAPNSLQQRFVAILEEFNKIGLETPDYYVLRSEKAFTRAVPSDTEDDTSTPDEYHVLDSDPWANYRHGDAFSLSSSDPHKGRG